MIIHDITRLIVLLSMKIYNSKSKNLSITGEIFINNNKTEKPDIKRRLDDEIFLHMADERSEE